MLCPQCGYDIGNANKCLRCGFTVKTLAVVDNENEETKKDDAPETIIIDPSETYITSAGYDDDFGGSLFGDPFASLFGDVFDPIGDLLGGLFGFDIRPERPQRQKQHATEEDMREHKKRKREAAPVVEVKAGDVEIVDEHGDPVDESETHSARRSEGHAHKHADAPKHAHPHYRRKDRK